MEGARVVGLHNHLPAPRQHEFEAEQAAQLALASISNGNGNISGVENSDPTSGNGNVDSGNGSGNCADEKVGPIIPSGMPDSSDMRELPSTSGDGAATTASTGGKLPRVHEENDTNGNNEGNGTVMVHVKENSIEKGNKRSGSLLSSVISTPPVSLID
jgi:hypothetical protein